MKPDLILAGGTLIEFQAPDFGETVEPSVMREPGLPLASAYTPASSPLARLRRSRYTLIEKVVPVMRLRNGNASANRARLATVRSATARCPNMIDVVCAVEAAVTATMRVLLTPAERGPALD